MEDKKEMKKPAEEGKEDVVLINKFLEVMSQYLHREGTNDYTKERLIIEEVRDKSGQKINPVWEKEWKEVVCGIETRMDSSDQQYVRIYRQACPVRIKFQKHYEYGTYDGYGDSRIDSHYYWVRYKTRLKLKEVIISAINDLILFTSIMIALFISGFLIDTFSILLFPLSTVNKISMAIAAIFLWGIKCIVLSFTFAASWLFFRRREIFPKMFIIWLRIVAVGSLIYLILWINTPILRLDIPIFHPSSSILLLYPIIGIILVIAWSLYFKKSQRLKDTFWRYKLPQGTPATRYYLSKCLLKEEFLILEDCLSRLDYDHGHLFWFCEDAKVHNAMEFCTEDKGFSSIEQVFTKQEIDVIRKTERLLNGASVSVKEELRVFCHF